MGRISIVALALLMSACGGRSGVEYSGAAGESAPVPACYFHEALAFVNHMSTTRDILVYAGVHRRAADSIVHARAGEDRIIGTSDDVLFTSIEELSALPYVGPAAVDALLVHASFQCDATLRLEGTECHNYEAAQLASSTWATEATLRGIGVSAASARALVAHRHGIDGVGGTSDDVSFVSLKHLDDVAGVGDKTIEALVSAGVDICDGAERVVFSPQSYDTSHLSRVEASIDDARESIDVAMYSFRDTNIFDALVRAVDRGIRVRVMYEAASAHRKDPEGTMSARLEDAGIEVRWVNKIMHHKFAIIDGPQQSRFISDSFQLITGSGNWSYSAATKYDENTLFFQDDDRLGYAFQAEFNLLWENGRAVIWNESIESIPHISIEPRDILGAQGSEVFFTSDNFRAYESNAYGPTFTLDGMRDTVVSEIVARIDEAQRSIKIASGHMRSRAILDAIINKKREIPDISIQVYLDGQEYISRWYHQEQLNDLEECLRDASTDTDDRNECMRHGYYFSYALVDAGIDTRFKYYSYRWHYSYAEQMHHKYLLIDDQYLMTGSYNFSNNAEYNTFENMIVLDAEVDPVTVMAYRRNHEIMWGANRAKFEPLLHEIQDGNQEIPLVFKGMALRWDEVTRLKATIRDECEYVNSESYREQPEKHKYCPRD